MGAISWSRSTLVSKAVAQWKQLVHSFGREKTSREMKSAPVYEKLSDVRLRERSDILSHLHAHPVSNFMHSFFRTLAEGSSDWEIVRFIEGAKRFASLANLTGVERVECYGHPLLGLHSQSSFSQLWNTEYPNQPITVWDVDFKRQCPPGWSTKLQNGVWILSHRGKKPISQGLNELLLGPTTLDCGMFCELLIWMAIRHLLGDTVFDNRFNLGEGCFTLTQTWNVDSRGRGSVGNILYPFYDSVPVWETDEYSCQTSAVYTRSFFNHDTYLMKHPGGEARLHNVIQIDDSYLIFDPGVPQNILSHDELDERLRWGYNIPRSVADLERLWLYSRWPQVVHPAFAPKTFEMLAVEARDCEHHMLTKRDWESSRPARTHKANGSRYRLNFRRLVDSVTQTERGDLDDAITRARWIEQDFTQRENAAAMDRLSEITREGCVFSNMDIVNEIINQGYFVAVLGKAILPFRAGQVNTRSKLFIAFVKLERVTRRRLGTSEFANGYHSAFPTATPTMLKAIESDNPLISLCLLNPTARECGGSYRVPRKLIRHTTYGEVNQVLIPYIVLSKGLRGIDIHQDVTYMKPMTQKTVPANEKPVIHMIFSLQDCNDNSVERDSWGQYLGWEHGHTLGICYLYTRGAVYDSIGLVDTDETRCG